METEKGTIFDIQRYSIHDGPGIRTTVFLKGCPLRCYWCQNPESQAFEPEILFDRSKCTCCGRCVAICPAGALGLAEGAPVMDRARCTGCGKCVAVCPAEARRLVGRVVTVGEVMATVLRDARFYEHSGGGVTLSGGEAAAQPRFSLALLKACKAAGLHTALDTCGAVSWAQLSKLLPCVDLVLYDIKHMDPRRHAAATGRDNRLILANARKIAECKPIRVRVPLIPGFNDSPAAIRAIARFAKEALHTRDIDLLPYNRLGEGKYALLGKTIAPLRTQDEDRLRALEALLEKP